MKFFGEVEKQNIRDGDIVTDDTHVGIVYYNRNENCYKTIEANQFQVTTSDWGITYTYDNKKAKYYRYDGRFYHYPKRGMVIWWKLGIYIIKKWLVNKINLKSRIIKTILRFIKQ